MDDVLLTLYCARADRGTIADALQRVCREPLHIRDEDVRGRDFEDAHTGEQVTGMLARCAIEVVLEQGEIDALLAAAGAARRKQPVRWHVSPVIARGRIA